jgi:hypothetical protein
MAAHIFSYPTVAAATSTLTFNDGTTGIARLQEDEDALSFNDELGTTFGGTDRACEYGTQKTEYSFTFIVPETKTSSETDLADVKTFIGTVRRLYTFQWTDVDASGSPVRTVRLVTNPVRWTRLGGKWFKITLQLREQ